MSRSHKSSLRRKADTPISTYMADLFEEPKRHKATRYFQLGLPERSRVVGRALVCGQGEMGQLGLGHDESKWERKRPAVVEGVQNVVDVCAGGMHSLVLTVDGDVYSFGCNDEGALGRDSSEEGSEFEPHLIELPAKVLKISAGDSHSACLLADGRVFAWGSFRDSHGNMGLTLEGNKRLPIDVLPDYLSCDIASGSDHLVILTNGGKVFTVGCAEQGQLGRISHRSASGEGRRGKTDLLRPAEVIIRRVKYIDAIWATNYCTFVREAASGTIWAFGLNNFKQLAYDQRDQTVINNPVATRIDNVKQIAGGQHHTMVLKIDGTCHVIGRYDYGRLGLGRLNADVSELMPVTTLASENIISIGCGEVQSFAITEDGKLYAWGMGSSHQLGTGEEDDVLSPQLIVSKQTTGKRILVATSGGQHSIFLVKGDTEENKEKTTSSTAVVEPQEVAMSTNEIENEESKGSTDKPNEDKATETKPVDKKEKSQKANTKVEKLPKVAPKAEKLPKTIVKPTKSTDAAKQPANSNGDIEKDETPSSTTNDVPPNEPNEGNEAVAAKRNRTKM